MHYLLAQKWRLGTALGLTLGSLLVLAFHFGWHTELGIEKPIRWLASCPPLAWHWVIELSREIQYGILIAWWVMAAGTIGWLIDGHKPDKAIAALFIVTVISAHQLAYDNIGLSIERQIQHFKMEVDRLF